MSRYLDFPLATAASSSIFALQRSHSTMNRDFGKKTKGCFSSKARFAAVSAAFCSSIANPNCPSRTRGLSSAACRVLLRRTRLRRFIYQVRSIPRAIRVLGGGGHTHPQRPPFKKILPGFQWKCRPSTVRSDEWPAWLFSFWFSGCWRALAKGTAWAGFYCAILLLLVFRGIFFTPNRP